MGGPLVLRHANKRSSGTWGPDDYDVIDGHGRHIGRISKPRAGVPADHPWEWAITGAVVMPRLPSHGFCATTRVEHYQENCGGAGDSMGAILTRALVA